MKMEKSCKTFFSQTTKERCIAQLGICGSKYNKIFTTSKLKKNKSRRIKRQRLKRILHNSGTTF